jgi:hypothetical protein
MLGSINIMLVTENADAHAGTWDPIDHVSPESPESPVERVVRTYLGSLTVPEKRCNNVNLRPRMNDAHLLYLITLRIIAYRTLARLR